MFTTPKHCARGKVIDAGDGVVTFNPADTNYQLRLRTTEREYTGPVKEPIECVIRVVARKIWTVPSGGLFITPIFGPPRILQGRVQSVGMRELVVHAGTSIAVELPASVDAFDLAAGSIEVGSIVNVTALPGATFELFEPARPRTE